MLIVALVLAVVGLAALVTAVVTSNEVIAWVCIGASALGVVLLVVDAVRERQSRRAAVGPATVVLDETEVVSDDQIDGETTEFIADESDEDPEIAREIADEDHPDEVIHDEPEYDVDSGDEPEYPEAAEAAAIHIVEDPESPVEDLVTEESVSEPEGR